MCQLFFAYSSKSEKPIGYVLRLIKSEMELWRMPNLVRMILHFNVSLRESIASRFHMTGFRFWNLSSAIVVVSCSFTALESRPHCRVQLLFTIPFGRRWCCAAFGLEIRRNTTLLFITAVLHHFPFHRSLSRSCSLGMMLLFILNFIQLVSEPSSEGLMRFSCLSHVDRQTRESAERKNFNHNDDKNDDEIRHWKPEQQLPKLKLIQLNTTMCDHVVHAAR